MLAPGSDCSEERAPILLCTMAVYAPATALVLYTILTLSSRVLSPLTSMSVFCFHVVLYQLVSGVLGFLGPTLFWLEADIFSSERACHYCTRKFPAALHLCAVIYLPYLRAFSHTVSSAWNQYFLRLNSSHPSSIPLNISSSEGPSKAPQFKGVSSSPTPFYITLLFVISAM